MNTSFIATCIALLTALLLPFPLYSAVLSADTTWSGEVSVDENILIPQGVTLRIAPGTVIKVVPSEGTKTDPEFISFLTEITVRGSLVADGRESEGIQFLSTGTSRSGWAGIIIDGGRLEMNNSIVAGAETAVDVLSGDVSLNNVRLEKNRYGLTVQGTDARVAVRKSRIENNDYGLFLLNGAEVTSDESVVQGNRKKDRFTASAKVYHPMLTKYDAQDSEDTLVYADEVFLGTVVWKGKVRVNGTIRVPLSGRLIILPGTVVEFSKKDTNNDGIGENGLFIQGGIIAKGTKEMPIIFRSAEKVRGRSDWDSINILNSDRAQNLIEYCQIENAYRGMHFHFANVAVKETAITNNSRGIQFQESIVELSNTHFYNNNSALWARDSEISFHDNLVYGNYSGINFFRNVLSFHDNVILNNRRGGLRIREGMPVVERNLIDGNRYGLLVVDSVYGTFSGNVISHNLETGVSLRGPVNIEISGNFIQENGLYGISIQDSSAVIKGNHIADNGERGVGVISFHGLVTGNNIIRNGLYNLGIDGSTDVAAEGNWWGAGDVSRTIFDAEDDPEKGHAAYVPMMEKPAILTWPLQNVHTDTTWQEPVIIKKTVTVSHGTDLAISPSARVLFARGAGLVVKGRIFARGEKSSPVLFTSFNSHSAEAWDEIRLEHANGSVLSNCIFEYATWALHVHFTKLLVEDCSFRKNYGGLRFRSGPVAIMNSNFQGNEIGLRTNRGLGVLSDSTVTGNRIGIFVREKGSRMKIRRNNLFANTDYNIRVGDFNDEDVDARDNWWGGADPGDTVFDERYEPGIGRVNYLPIAEVPFALDAPDAEMNRGVGK